MERNGASRPVKLNRRARVLGTRAIVPPRLSLRTVDNMESNPYEPIMAARPGGSVKQALLRTCFGSLWRTTISGAVFIYFILCLTAQGGGSSVTGRQGNEVRFYGVCPVVVVEYPFEIMDDGSKHRLPMQITFQMNLWPSVVVLGAISILSFVFALILYPFWRRWAV